MRIWVDTDFGFDDLWALLLLKHLKITVDGVSLVAGNAPLSQVTNNAKASRYAFDFNWPIYSGADKPLVREAETAERILGQFGMQSRGLFLPYDAVANGSDNNNGNKNSSGSGSQINSAVDAMAHWLIQESQDPRHIIALGPLTNLALLVQHYPDATKGINQITWLGGSGGRGNHSQYAEYNALADPEALSIIEENQLPLRIIDLELCRQVSFGEADVPSMHGKNHQLLADLLGGYLDIALERGRMSMSIYDPLAALSAVNNDLFKFEPKSLEVNTTPDAKYGQTRFSDVKVENNNISRVELAVAIDAEQAREICLSALINH